MIIFDTTIWIDALNGKKTNAVGLLIEKILANEVALLPVIIQEILQGIKDDAQFEKVKENLSGFVVLELDPIESAIGAAVIYRNLRKKGLTIRKPNDCLIAFYAVKFNLKLVHNDSDFELIASNTDLKEIKI
jgi:predicted nucleic acid-binding protein